MACSAYFPCSFPRSIAGLGFGPSNDHIGRPYLECMAGTAAVKDQSRTIGPIQFYEEPATGLPTFPLTTVSPGDHPTLSTEPECAASENRCNLAGDGTTPNDAALKLRRPMGARARKEALLKGGAPGGQLGRRLKGGSA